MDEMNPAYENFLNNMSRLGGTPRETTRRVSASKFLGRDDLETRIKLNERKITILKNIIQTQQMTTGIMLTSLSGPVEGIEQSIVDIKKTISSILETLKAQDKFEYEKFLDAQRRNENARRRKRETTLENVGEKGLNLIGNQVKKVLSPITSIFSSIINGFIALVGGKILQGLVGILTNPAVQRVILGISGFIERFFPIIVGAIGNAIVGIVTFLDRMNLLIPAMYTLAGAIALRPFTGLISQSFGPTRVARLGVTRTAPTFKKQMMFFRNPDLFKFFPRKFNRGGLVPGTGNTDTVPAMLTPGEVVISKPAVEKFGAINLLNLNKAAGSSSKPKIKKGITYANEGAVVMPNLGEMFGAVIGSLQELENSDLSKTLSDPNIPETLKTFSESLAIPKDQQIKAAQGVTDTVFNRIGRSITSSDFSNKLMTTDSPTTPNLLPFNKLKSMASGVDFKSLFSDVLNKVNPQSDAPQNNDTFRIQLNSPNQNKLETLGLII